jgi:hypothetical protein
MQHLVVLQAVYQRGRRIGWIGIGVAIGAGFGVGVGGCRDGCGFCISLFRIAGLRLPPSGRARAVPARRRAAECRGTAPRRPRGYTRRLRGGMPALSVPSKDKLVKAAITDNHIARKAGNVKGLSERRVGPLRSGR